MKASNLLTCTIDEECKFTKRFFPVLEFQKEFIPQSVDGTKFLPKTMEIISCKSTEDGTPSETSDLDPFNFAKDSMEDNSVAFSLNENESKNSFSPPLELILSDSNEDRPRKRPTACWFNHIPNEAEKIDV